MYVVLACANFLCYSAVVMQARPLQHEEERVAIRHSLLYGTELVVALLYGTERNGSYCMYNTIIMSLMASISVQMWSDKYKMNNFYKVGVLPKYFIFSN